MSLAVVYLARGLGAGLPAAARFLASYRLFPAGVEHDLIILAKGWADDSDRISLSKLAQVHNAVIYNLPDDGYDWGAYFRGARLLPYDRIMLLNSHSEVLAPGWLSILANALSAEGIGCVGATASWGTHRPVTRFIRPLVGEALRERGLVPAMARAGKLAIAFGPQWLGTALTFPAFPNPHLRSNAIIMHRDMLAAYASSVTIPVEKRDAHALEGGARSLGRFLASRGLSCRLVDRDGAVYAAEEWPDAATFRVPGQPGLLVADNQTRAYDEGTREQKRLMELTAWGRFFTPA